MAGLFSDAGEQLGNSMQNLGHALIKGGLTIYDKLETAEETSQFNVGQTQLVNAMNQFDYQRSTKGATDFLNWQDQNTKAMDEWWATIEKTLSNQGAKNKLNAWLQEQKISRSRRIEEETIRARINTLGGQYEGIRKQTINDPGLDADAKVSKLTRLANQYVDIGAINPQAAQDHLFADAHALYKNGNLSAIMKQMEAQGTQAGFDWGNDPNSDYGQMLTPEERTANSEAAKRSREVSLALRQKQANVASNDSLTTVNEWVASDKIPDDAIARITGDASDPQTNLKFPSVLDGPDKVFDGSKQQQAALKLIENKTKALRGGGSAKPSTKQYLAAGALEQKIWARDSSYSIDKMDDDIDAALKRGDIVGSQYDHLLTLTLQAGNKDIAEVKSQLSKGLAHNDPVTGQAVGWYDSEVYSKIMSMTDDYIAAQHNAKGGSTIDAQKLHAYVDELTNKTMDAAISDYLNGQYVSPMKFLGIKFGEKLDNDKISSALAAFSSKDTYTTGQGKSVMGVLKADLGETLAKKGITGDLNVGNFNGTIYPALIAKDGIYGYFTEKGAAVIKKSTDGKTWQTIK